MNSSAKFGVFGLLLALLLLFSFQEERGVMVEAKGRTCESQSHTFHGQCWSGNNCGQVCKNEGFHGGKCRGFRKRCFCTRPCPAQ